MFTFPSTWISIFLNVLFSMIIIYFIHMGWNYLLDTYSIKKTKNLVNTQIQKYKKIIDEMQEENKNVKYETPIKNISVTDKKTMQDELNDFIKDLQ